MKKILFSIMLLATAALPKAEAQNSNTVWLNEFHYDGQSIWGTSDTREFVELVVQKAIADNPTELAKYKLVLYTAGGVDSIALDLTNGRGRPYNAVSSWYSQAETEHSLANSDNNAVTGFQRCAIAGNTDFVLLYKKMPVLMDVPSAFAITYNNSSVIQLLSYEKQFRTAPATFNGGVAANMNTTLIRTTANVAQVESATTDSTSSIYLTGGTASNGNEYSDYTWTNNGAPTNTAVATPCAVNTAQAFSSAVLAVDLVGFDAEAKGNDALLMWNVASAKNTEFTIERALKGKGFEAIVSFNSQQNRFSYDYTDANLAPGTYEFRLRQPENGGGYRYSDVRSVVIKPTQALWASEVSPNPMSNQGNIRIASDKAQALQVNVYNAVGQQVATLFNGKLQAGEVREFNLNGTMLAQSGTYFVKVKGEKGSEMVKTFSVNK